MADKYYQKNKAKISERNKKRTKARKIIQDEQKKMSPDELLSIVGYD